MNKMALNFNPSFIQKKPKSDKELASELVASVFPRKEAAPKPTADDYIAEALKKPEYTAPTSASDVVNSFSKKGNSGDILGGLGDVFTSGLKYLQTGQGSKLLTGLGGDSYTKGAFADQSDEIQKREDADKALFEQKAAQNTTNRFDYGKTLKDQDFKSSEADKSQKEENRRAKLLRETQLIINDKTLSSADKLKRIELAAQKANNDADNATNIMVAEINARARAAAGNGTSGKKLTSVSSRDLSDMAASVQLLQQFPEKIKKTGFKPGPVAGRLNVLNPYNTGAKSFQQISALQKQIIGKSLEGGVLRKEDEKKYENILITPHDTPEVIQAKLNELQSQILTKHNAQLQGFEDAGYNTGTLKPITGKQIIFSNDDNKFESLAAAEKANLPPGTTIQFKDPKTGKYKTGVVEE